MEVYLFCCGSLFPPVEKDLSHNENCILSKQHEFGGNVFSRHLSIIFPGTSAMVVPPTECHSLAVKRSV